MARETYIGQKPPETSFRLTKEARNKCVKWLDSLTEQTAYDWFKERRFRDNGGAPFCPRCESTRVYDLASRPKWWKCARKGCHHQFSVTSGTILHSRKLSFVSLVKIIFCFADCAKGRSACEMHLVRNHGYQTMWVNLMKIRESMSSTREDVWLREIIEIDAAYFGGKIRPANRKSQRDQQDRRKAEFQKGKRAIMVVRQRQGKTVMFAADDESPAVARAIARQLVDHTGHGALLITDQATAYNDLEAFAPHMTVDHSKGFMSDGISTNQAESAFSRARRSEIGIYHHWSPTWLDFYAGEMSWRENQRKVSTHDKAQEMLDGMLSHPVSRNLKGYWQHYQLPFNQRERGEQRWSRVHAHIPPRTQRLANE